MAVKTKPKNVIPTVVYLRGNEVSRIKREGKEGEYEVATDEEIQAIIDAWGGGVDPTYIIATDEQIEKIIKDYNDDDFPPKPPFDDDGESNQNNNNSSSNEEDDDIEEYNIASDDEIQRIIDDFGK